MTTDDLFTLICPELKKQYPGVPERLYELGVKDILNALYVS
jgi:hypothetical protein